MAGIYAAMAKKQKARRQHLADQPLSEISGVIYPGGLGGSGGGTSGTWNLSVTLNPWRVAGGQLKHTKINLAKDSLPQNDFQKLMDSMSSYQVIRVSARYSEFCPEWDTPQGDIDSVIENKFKDPELCRHAKELKRPFILMDPFFGKMTLVRTVNWLKCKRRSGWFSSYEVCVSRNGEDYDSSRAKDIVISLESRMSQVRKAVKESLYQTYSDEWKSLGPLSAEQFTQRIKLYSIAVDQDGSSSCWFRDGGLFLGHDVEVKIDQNGVIEGADIVG